MSRSDLVRSDLVHHLARFARALREHGVEASLSDEADGLAALTLVDLGDRDEVRLALRTALKIRPRDAAVFEELFAQLWSVGEEAQASRPAPPRLPPQSHGPSSPRPAPRPAAWPTAPTPAADVLPTGDEPGYSPEAVLRRKPFEELSAADLQAMERLLSRLALRLATRPSRRRVPTRGRWLDELVNGQTIVLILSDGLDRGDVQPLQGAMRAIRGGPGGSCGSPPWPETGVTSPPPEPWRRRSRTSTASCRPTTWSRWSGSFLY
jgi:uncharacterized protein with von Willebrand factor type A (vWA) domain